MFNFSLSTYIITGLLVILLVVSGLFYVQIGKTSEAESALASAINANTSLQKSLELKEQSCQLTDKLLKELQGEQAVIVDEKNSLLDKLNKLPPIKSVKSNESSVASIDDSLPNELIGLLKQSRGGDKAGDAVHP
jgi:hypothetical protein